MQWSFYSVLFQSKQATYILTYYIKFKVYNTALLNLMKISVFVCIGNDGYLETVISGFYNGQTDSINSYRTFVNCHIAFLSHLFIILILEGVIPAAFSLCHVFTYSCLIHMPLHNMTVKPAVHRHAALQIYFTANFQ